MSKGDLRMAQQVDLCKHSRLIMLAAKKEHTQQTITIEIIYSKSTQHTDRLDGAQYRGRQAGKSTPREKKQ